jgi:hypothetical protein
MKILTFVVGALLVRAVSALDVEVFNRIPTNAVVVCDGAEFEVLSGGSVVVSDASGVLVWQDTNGLFVLAQNLLGETVDEMKLVLGVDSAGQPIIRAQGIDAPWRRQWQWYLGGFSVGMGCFFYAASKRAVDKTILGGGDASD